MATFLSRSPEETFHIGSVLGCELPLPSVVYLFGELAAGKTTLIKGIVSGAARIDPSEVQSPTFSYLHLYRAQRPVYHFDLYRLRDLEEFLSMGFDEYFEAEAICCLEWSERLLPHLPVKGLCVSLTHVQEEQRAITIDDAYRNKLENWDLGLAGVPGFNHSKPGSHSSMDPFLGVESRKPLLKPNTDSSAYLGIPE